MITDSADEKEYRIKRRTVEREEEFSVGKYEEIIDIEHDGARRYDLVILEEV